MKWIAFTNQKGGVAKTTSALAFADILSHKGYNVLMLDLDPHADLTLSVGIKEDMRKGNLYDVFLGEKKPDQIWEKLKPNLYLIPSGLDLTLADRDFLGKVNYSEFLKSHLSDYVEKFNFIIMDCPPSLGSMTITAISISDFIIIPTQAEYLSYAGVQQTIDIIQMLKQKGLNSPDWKILITMFDVRNRVARDVYRTIQKKWKEKIFSTNIGVDTKIKEAQALGRLFSFHSANTRALNQYRRAVEEMLKDAEKGNDGTPELFAVSTDNGQ